jgi:predicted RNA methylase
MASVAGAGNEDTRSDRARTGPSKSKSLLLKYMLFKSLGPDKHCFAKLNAAGLWSKYEIALEAFAKKVGLQPDDQRKMTVVDVGAGWGILSLLAARALAKCWDQAAGPRALGVVKVEGMTPIASAVRRFFAVHSQEFDSDSDESCEDEANNGAPVEFSVIPFVSDIPSTAGAADLVLVDTLSPVFFTGTSVAGGLGRGVIECLRSLGSRGLVDSETTTILPSHTRVYAQLVYIPPQSSVPPMSFCVNEVSGFDVSLFNQFRGEDDANQRLDYTPMSSITYTKLTEPVCMDTFDLKAVALSAAEEESWQFKKRFEANVETSGSCNAVIYWHASLMPFNVDGDLDEVSFEPDNDVQSLVRQGVYIMPFPKGRQEVEERILTAGTSVAFRVECDSNRKYPFTFAFDRAEVGNEVARNAALPAKETPRLSAVAEHGVSRWHFSMLWDKERNRAYDLALQKIIAARQGNGGGTKVLDIGTGTGLLAMMAARAGASRVVACELNSAVAECAVAICEKNGFSKDQITVLPVKSNDVPRVHDEPGKFDICVSEILDCGLLGENVLPSIQDARERLLKDDAVVIPHSAKVYGILISLDLTQGAPLSILPADGQTDVSLRTGQTMDTRVFKPFARGTTAYEQIRLEDVRHTKLSAPFELFHGIDLASGTTPPQEVYPYVDVARTGMAHGVAIYFDLYLDSEKSIVLSTGPSNKRTCWAQAVQFFTKPQMITSGGNGIVLRARHDCSTISVDVFEE